jgi:RHS repeat-associated protein
MSGWAMKTAEGEMQREKTTPGRRIAKSYDGQTVARYLHDGAHILADYDGNGTLLHKYIYGPDTPAKSEAPSTKSETGSKHQSAMIETRPPARWTVWDFGRQSLGHVSSFDIRISDLSPCYYHYDGLGSVVALSDEAGDTVEVYEYSIFGQVAASDPNHPNRFLFTGREFDSETGLYYYRARYYNPYIGRFLQTDPAGDGMNPYTYCGNDPVCAVDSSGMYGSFGWCGFRQQTSTLGTHIGIRFWWFDLKGNEHTKDCVDVEEWIEWASGGNWKDPTWEADDTWIHSAIGWRLARQAGGDDDNKKWWFWRLRAVMMLGVDFTFIDILEHNAAWLSGVKLERSDIDEFKDYLFNRHTVRWNPDLTHAYRGTKKWFYMHALASLAHELSHLKQDYLGYAGYTSEYKEIWAIQEENYVRKALFCLDPTEFLLYPRPSWRETGDDFGPPPSPTAQQAWDAYDQDLVSYD